MQILNVGAGQSDEEYRAAEEQRRADLVADSRSDANFFFWAVALAALGTGMLPVRLNIIVNIGVVDLLSLYGRTLGTVYGVAWLWIVVVAALGFAARRGHRWAFLAGIVLYAADMVALVVTFSIWAFGIHAFFLLKWYQGQKALKDLREMGGVKLSMVAQGGPSSAAGA